MLIAYIFQSLFSTTAFGLGGKYFAFYEEEGVGVQWNNIYISPVEDDQYNLLMVLMMMMFDAFLYAMIAWYIENVFPGKKITVLPAKSDSDFMFCLQSYQGLIINRSLVY